MDTVVCKACGHENATPAGGEFDACPACDRIYSRVQAALDARAAVAAKRASARSDGPVDGGAARLAQAMPAPDPQARSEPGPTSSASKAGSASASVAASNLVPCADCGHQVSRNAEKCPSCGVKRTTPADMAGAWAVVLILAVVVFFWMSGPSGTSGPSDYCAGGGERAARAIAREFVRDRLRSPASAAFSGDTAHMESACVYQVRGAVDSQNGFGAMIRSHYRVEVRYWPYSEEWGLVDLLLE